MSAGEGAPGEESQPGTERGWGRWWGVAALGGEATCLGREGSLPGKELRSGQSIQTGEQRKNAEGGTSGRTKGRGSHLTHSYSPTPPTGYILGTGLVSNPTSAGGQETHLSGFTALSFFFGLKSKTDRDKEEENQESPASYSVAPDPRPTGSTLKILVPTAVSHHAQHPQSLVSASSDVGPGWHLHSHWLCSSRDISPS